MFVPLFSIINCAQIVAVGKLVRLVSVDYDEWFSLPIESVYYAVRVQFECFAFIRAGTVTFCHLVHFLNPNYGAPIAIAL